MATFVIFADGNEQELQNTQRIIYKCISLYTVLDHGLRYDYIVLW